MDRHFHRLFLIATIALAPILLSSFTWRCNSISLHLRTWGVEYKFEKGACTSDLKQQIEPVKNDM